jgi:ATP-dependent helicase/nuclease subunit A
LADRIKWSDEQLKAINHNTERDGSAIVSAAAGSGKTAMLVARITRLITDPALKIPADKIVAVTFTNDAAGELKARLESAINDIEPKSEWLTEQLINLENANICTISSFCLKLIRDYTEVLGLKPNFTICEGKEREYYSDTALNHALDSIYENPETVRILRSVTGTAGDLKLGNIILELYDEYIKQPFPENWLIEKEALYNNIPAFKDLIVNNAVKEIKEKAGLCLEYIEECFVHSYNDSMKKRLDSDKQFAESRLYGERGQDEYGNSNYSNVSSENIHAKEIIKEYRDIYVPIFKEIIITAGTIRDFEFVTEKQAPQVRALISLFMLYINKFRKLKKEANCADFSDAEHLVLELLKNKEIAEEIKENFYEIIVDEFQDSNSVQYEIFKSISKNNRNLFLVGDVKQSIYRFRNADQRVFVNVTEDENFTALTLNKNYRSSKEVIDAVNNVFENTMTKDIGGVDYDENARLVFGTGIESGEDYKAEIIITENEAMYIASRIKSMVDNGFMINERNCDYGDFAVLISGLSTVEEEFSAAFEAYNLPFDKQKSGDYTEVPEIKTIISLLTVIDRPFENMELLTVLMSPLYDFTIAEIAEIRINGVHRTLFDNLEAAQTPKARAFLNDFYRWSAYTKNSGACKLIRRIYDEGVFNPLVAASINPEKTMFNVRLLLYYSENLKSLTHDTLSGLINILSSQNNNTVLEEARFTGDIGSKRIKLMTIHASKGLEFPICFIARTSAAFNLRENYSDVIFNDEIGIAMRYMILETYTKCDTFTHNTAKKYNKEAAISEEMRKLYVACTRAKNKLILTGTENPAENSYFNWLKQSNINIETINETAEIPEPINEKNVQSKITTAIQKDYHREPLTQIPRRFTATQIGIEYVTAINETQDEPTVFPRMPSFMNNRKLTGKKRGDVYHKLMELLDFKNPDYEGQIQSFKDCFTEEEFAAIEVNQILAFFNSELGKRAVKSPKVQKEFMLCTEINLSELGFQKEYDEIYDDKPLVQGIADMFFYEDGKIILVDYKTNRNTSQGILSEQYKKQLEIYARAIEEMTGDTVAELWIYSFEIGEVELKLH